MRFAVLGSGPSGYYASQALLKRFPSARIDIIEQLPVPFGLVRYGVAPDHPATKAVISGFSKFMENNQRQVRFLGNIPALARPDLSLNCLNEMYNLTIVATGASRPRTLPCLDHKQPLGVYTAHDFILWLNGHPHLHERERLAANSSHNSMENMLKSARGIGVLGQGNVAVDVARLLLRPIDDFRSTDISPQVLDALASCSTRTVSLVGRRSPRYASWTTAALREVVSKIPGIETTCDHSLIRRDLELGDVARVTKRTLKLLIERTSDSGNGKRRNETSESNKLHLEFLLEPRSIQHRLGAVQVEFAENEMKQRGNGSEVSVGPTGRIIARKYDAAVLSLGYVGGKGDGIRVGWANGLARGIIGDNKWDAETTVQQIPETVLDHERASSKSGIDEWISKNNWQVIDWCGWKRIDEEERRRASAMGGGRERIKLESVAEMLLHGIR